jgi:hypothetical protein
MKKFLVVVGVVGFLAAMFVGRPEIKFCGVISLIISVFAMVADRPIKPIAKPAQD